MSDDLYTVDDGPTRPGPAPVRPVVVPIAAPAARQSKSFGWSTLWVVLGVSLLWASILAAMYVAIRPGMDRWPIPEPPATEIERATKDYLATLPSAYGKTADAIASGAITDKQGAFTSLQSHAQPLANALDDGFKPFIDDKGKIVNKAGAVAMLRDVQVSLSKGK